MGHEQHGDRDRVVVQAEVDGHATRVLVEQIGAVDAGRLAELCGHRSPDEMWGVDEALATVRDPLTER